MESNISPLSCLIAKIKPIIDCLDILEEFRDLSVEEWNFREILSKQLISLINQQKIYWKQRGTIKWVKFGDGNTQFFHANATIKYTRNSTTSLDNGAGSVVFDHQSKATLLWEAYKDRLGKSKFVNIESDLSNLLSIHPDLSSLEDPFTKEEIDAVIENSLQISHLGQMVSILTLLKNVGLLFLLIFISSSRNFIMEHC